MASTIDSEKKALRRRVREPLGRLAERLKGMRYLSGGESVTV